MHGSSRAAAKAVQEAFEVTLRRESAASAGASAEEASGVGGVIARAVDKVGEVLGRSVDLQRLAEDLFGVTTAIDQNIPLRRAVADPSREGVPKAALVEQLFGARIGSDALDVLKAAVSQRWSEERDLTDTLEGLAVSAVVARAEQEGRADQLEDELFRFERIVAGNSGLRDALTDRRSAIQGKHDLVSSLLQDKASPETLRLVQQAVRAPRGRRFDQVLEAYLRIAATRQQQLAATVTSAVDLDATQRDRLAAALSSFYGGKTVHLNVVLDPSVIGGIRVQIGDDVVDGTILRRLEAARRHLGG